MWVGFWFGELVVGELGVCDVYLVDCVFFDDLMLLLVVLILVLGLVGVFDVLVVVVLVCLVGVFVGVIVDVVMLF